MLTCINLNNSNLEHLKKLNKNRRSFNELNEDFFKTYNKMNFVQKYFLKKNVKLLKNDEEYIGYIWVDNNYSREYKIKAMNVNKVNNLLECLKKLLNSINKNNTYTYECQQNEKNTAILKELGFKKATGNIELLCSLTEDAVEPLIIDEITIRKFIINRDEKLRCYIQNKIFEKDDRIPLSVQDIFFDEAQEYYFNEGCYFISEGKKVIGYGQIIVSDAIATIVNFGILKEYRKKGYGRYFLNFLKKVAKDNGFKKIYIKVDWDNEVAFKLYKAEGFKVLKEVDTWKLNICQN